MGKGKIKSLKLWHSLKQVWVTLFAIGCEIERYLPQQNVVKGIALAALLTFFLNHAIMITQV